MDDECEKDNVKLADYTGISFDKILVEVKVVSENSRVTTSATELPQPNETIVRYPHLN
jgi:hypothetical protein